MSRSSRISDSPVSGGEPAAGARQLGHASTVPPGGERGADGTLRPGRGQRPAAFPLRLLPAPRRPRHPQQHPPFPPSGGHLVRDRHPDTLLLWAVFSKLDGLTRFPAPLLPTPISSASQNRSHNSLVFREVFRRVLERRSCPARPLRLPSHNRPILKLTPASSQVRPCCSSTVCSSDPETFRILRRSSSQAYWSGAVSRSAGSS